MVTAHWCYIDSNWAYVRPCTSGEIFKVKPRRDFDCIDSVCVCVCVSVSHPSNCPMYPRNQTPSLELFRITNYCDERRLWFSSLCPQEYWRGL